MNTLYDIGGILTSYKTKRMKLALLGLMM